MKFLIGIVLLILVCLTVYFLYESDYANEKRKHVEYMDIIETYRDSLDNVYEDVDYEMYMRRTERNVQLGVNALNAMGGSDPDD